jgi:hypothetical protein
MTRKCKSYRVYRDDESDDENNEDVPQARVITLRKNGRLVSETHRSPQKRGVIRKPRPVQDDWQPNDDFYDAGFEDLRYGGSDIGEDVSGDDAVEGAPVATQAAAKRYPTSVREG